MKRRQAFTLVELMVSMALIIFIMAILSQAFVAALGTFRNLKGQGDLAEKLRSSAQILQHDLAADHFDSHRRLSDPTFWNNGPPQQGFFQVYQDSTGTIQESALGDSSGINSFLSTKHALSFTVRLIGNDMGDFMSASALGGGALMSTNPFFGPSEARYQLTSGGAYNYQWAAVAWFLAPQGRIDPSTNTFVQDTTAPDPDAKTTGVPLYMLYRRQCLLVPDNNLVALSTTPMGGYPSAQIGNFIEMSCLKDPKNPNLIAFNSPRDITMPANRGTTSLDGWGGLPNYIPIPATSPLFGSDIQLNDVVSFDVRLLPLYPKSPVPTAPPNPADPFVTLFDPPFTLPPATKVFDYTSPVAGATTTSVKVFDTWSSLSNGINDYSNWSTPGTSGTSIPFWTTNAVTYQYPVGTGRTMTLPAAATIYQATGTGPTSQATGSGPIILAIQITIRIWDFKTNQTRQVTIVQAM